MNITPVTNKDDLHDICAQLAASRWAKDNDMAEYAPTALSQFVDNDHNLLIVGRVNGQIVCSAICYMLDHPDKSRKSLYIDELDTHPDHRRKGYASDMIAWLRSFALERSLQEVWLATESKDNQAANAFYQSLKPTETVECNLYSYSAKQ